MMKKKLLLLVDVEYCALEEALCDTIFSEVDGK